MSEKLQSILFSKLSVVIHTIWFVVWFLLKLNINTLTLVVSLEAIYITLFIGLEQQNTHDVHKLIKEIHTKVHKKK